MSDQTLQPAEARDLRALAACIIPASARYGVPGADDEAIFADILRSIGRDRDDVRAALARLADLAGGARFAELDPAIRASIAEVLRAERSPAVAAATRVVLLCYYRDDRVMRSLDLEPRPPFPKGHVVEQGDWSLLDPVRKRAPLYRRVG
ncbi:MAG TPA: hypothetical protein VJ890_11035 [Vineibacter sp.]|nr:hypothetical protein [Vineibacter sp.]